MRSSKLILYLGLVLIAFVFVLYSFIFRLCTTFSPQYDLSIKVNKANQNRVLNGDLNDDSKVSLVLPLDGNLSEKDKVYQQYFSTSPIGQRRFLVLTDAGIKNLASKNEHKQLWEEEQYKHRRLQLQTRCEVSRLDRNLDLSRFIYDDRHKVVMCVVPKNACSSWKQIMLFLKGKITDKSQIENVSTTDLLLGVSEKLPTMMRLTHTEAMKRLLTYSTFIVSRHPFHRLVSAHSSKFTDRSLSSFYKKNIGQTIAAHQAKFYLNGLSHIPDKNHQFSLLKDDAFSRLSSEQKKAALHYIDIMNSGAITFKQLVDYITAWNESYDPFAYDVHWRPQVTLCNPCAVNYDFVVRFENLTKESNWLLKYLQRSDPPERAVYFDDSKPSLIDHNQTRNAFSTIKSKQIVNRLKELYADDFRLFGYSSDDIA